MTNHNLSGAVEKCGRAEHTTPRAGTVIGTSVSEASPSGLNAADQRRETTRRSPLLLALAATATTKQLSQ